jgi:enoyl-[acyl-carrier protein] reductase I
MRPSPAWATNGGSLDFLVHCIGFTDKNELKGRYADTTRENFVAHHGDLVLFLYRDRQARRRHDAGIRRLDHHPDVRRFDARDAELQCDGGGEGGAGSFRALSRFRFRTRKGIRVNAISAGPGAHPCGRRDRRFARSCSPSSKSIRRCGRGVTLDELGGSALYLLSDLSAGVTGEIHFVDSGYNIISMPRPEDIKSAE